MKQLFSRAEIASVAAGLGREISAWYEGKELTLMILANGGIFFGVDLARNISIPVYIDVIGLTSYVDDRKCGEPQFRCPPKLPVAGRHILLVDDVLDSGESIAFCARYFKEQGALSVRSAVLVEKAVGTRNFSADWKCFNAPDQYLVGSGMDSCEFYRNLDCIAVMEADGE